MDFTTPQGAVLMLEDAYRRADLEAAVKAKSFYHEAKRLLKETTPMVADDEQLIKKMADTLELAFRAQMKTDGFPDFNGADSTFLSVEPHSEGIVVVTEQCTFPNGEHSVQRILVAKIPEGWRVLNPID